MQSIQRYVQFIVGAADQSPDAGAALAEDPNAKTRKKRTKGYGTCPLCKKGKVLKNSRSYYCGDWNQGCQFSVWFSNYERYGEVLDDNLMKEVLAKETAVRDITLPQTGERGEATFFFTEKGQLEFKNFKKKESIGNE